MIRSCSVSGTLPAMNSSSGRLTLPRMAGYYAPKCLRQHTESTALSLADKFAARRNTAIPEIAVSDAAS